jgi:hypothetical protein
VKSTGLVALMFFLGGCVGISPADLRISSPVDTVSSSKSTDVITQCLLDKFNFLRPDRLLQNTYNNQGFSEFLIGAYQAGQMRYYYNIKIIDDKNGSQVEVRHSDGYYHPLSKQKLIESIKNCAY